MICRGSAPPEGVLSHRTSGSGGGGSHWDSTQQGVCAGGQPGRAPLSVGNDLGFRNPENLLEVICPRLCPWLVEPVGGSAALVSPEYLLLRRAQQGL